MKKQSEAIDEYRVGMLTVPPSDVNFKWALERANQSDITAALKRLRAKANTKTAIQKLESRLRALQSGRAVPKGAESEDIGQ